MTGYYDEAIEHYNEALRIDPKHAKAHANLGMALEKKGMDAEALTAYRRSLELQPDSKTVRLKLGYYYARTGKPDEAVRQYDEALRLDPDYDDAHYWKARALAESGRAGEAWKHFHRAESLGISDPAFRRELKRLSPEPVRQAEPSKRVPPTQEEIEKAVSDAKLGQGDKEAVPPPF